MAATRQAGIEPTALTRLGFPASRGIQSNGSIELVNGIDHRRLELRGVKHYTAVPPDRLLRAHAEMAGALVRRLRPDAIWAATPHLNGLVGMELRRRFGVPLVYDVRGFPEMTWAAEHGEGEEMYELRRAAESRLMREADLVMTLSETMAAEVEGRGVDRARVHVLPHAVERPSSIGHVAGAELSGRAPGAGTSIGDLPSAIATWRKRLGNVALLVGVATSLRGYEGIACLLEAVTAARNRGISLGLLVAGEGQARAELEQRAADLGLGEPVLFAGRLTQPEMSAFYSGLDVVAVPRLDFEVCRAVTPLKAVEAMAAGRCVVMSDLPPLRELAGSDGERAVLVPPGDPVQLAEALGRLAADPQERARLGASAGRWAATQHSFDNLTARFDATLASLKGAQGSREPRGAAHA